MVQDITLYSSHVRCHLLYFAVKIIGLVLHRPDGVGEAYVYVMARMSAMLWAVMANEIIQHSARSAYPVLTAAL